MYGYRIGHDGKDFNKCTNLITKGTIVDSRARKGDEQRHKPIEENLVTRPMKIMRDTQIVAIEVFNNFYNR